MNNTVEYNYDVLKDQIIFIRDIGVTNMFLVGNVQYLAGELGFSELEEFLNSRGNRNSYGNFILTGKWK